VDADLTVIGAGPAGAATAVFAARAGYRVVLIDRQAFPRDKPCGEGLMPSGRPALRALGLDGRLALSCPPLIGVQLGTVERQAGAKFPVHDGNQAGLGVRRIDFDNQLIECVLSEPRVEFHQQTQAVALRREEGWHSVATSQGEIRSPRVVVADGLRSSIRHQLGWTLGPRPPHRYGIIGHWKTDRPLDPWIRISFSEGLELYQGPVAQNELMVGLLCTQGKMRDFAGRLQTRYREIAQRLNPSLGDAEQVGTIHAVGPFWYRASTVADQGVFLVGDSGGFTDPITGEGIAAALRQALALAGALATANPERSYRRAHRRLTANPRRIAGLFLRLTRTTRLAERALRTQELTPQLLPKLLGVGFGYWGFERITPREWIRLFTGR
jgi:flavin-dependent dehydrogenase